MTLSELKQAELLADRLRPVRKAIGDIERQPNVQWFDTELVTGESFDGRRGRTRPQIDRDVLLAMLLAQEAIIVERLAALGVEAAQEDARG